MNETTPSRERFDHIERMVYFIAGMQVMTLSVVFYLLADKVGIEEPAATEIFSILFAAGFLMMLSKEIGTAIYRVISHVR